MFLSKQGHQFVPLAGDLFALDKPCDEPVGHPIDLGGRPGGWSFPANAHHDGLRFDQVNSGARGNNLHI